MKSENQVTEEQVVTGTDDSIKNGVEPTRRPIPASGRSGSFDEALELGMKKYDNALRELAK